MSRRARVRLSRFASLLLAGLVLAGLSAWRTRPSSNAGAHAAALPHHSLAERLDEARRRLAWSQLVEEPHGYVQPLDDGSRLELTLDGRLQHAAEALS